MTTEFVTQAALDAAFKKNHEALMAVMEKARGEFQETGRVSAETKASLEKIAEKGEEIGKRIDKIEARLNRGIEMAPGAKSAGQKFVESEDFKSLDLNGAARKSARYSVKAITNTPGQNQPLVPSDRRPGIVFEPNRALRIRDMLPVGRTSSNLIEYTQEVSFTNSAAPQAGGSPIEYENITKAESQIAFRLQQVPVVTLAHFILASKQVLSDAPMLQSYIDTRLTYGLKLVEEDQILNGSGSAGNISGLWTNRTSYIRGASGDTRIDTLRKAKTQLALANYQAEAVILNPADWEVVELAKDTQGRYILGNPAEAIAPRVWGLPVVVSNTMAAGSFLMGAFSVSAMIWDREDASVEVSREDGDNFKKNMVTILAEERLALEVSLATGLVGGTLLIGN